jgi:hypothetical protein
MTAVDGRSKRCRDNVTEAECPLRHCVPQSRSSCIRRCVLEECKPQGVNCLKCRRSPNPVPRFVLCSEHFNGDPFFDTTRSDALLLVPVGLKNNPLVPILRDGNQQNIFARFNGDLGATFPPLAALSLL